MLHFLLQKKLSFAIWSLPGKTDWQGIAQNDRDVEMIDLNDIYGANGFIVAPFDISDQVKLIRPDVEFNSNNFLLEDDSENSFTHSLDPENNDLFIIEKEAYLTSCNQLISNIKNGDLKKIILSRVMPVSFEADKLIRFFNSLIKTHVHAMVFIYSAGDGIWLGASPEVFLELRNDRFKTMALAGSKPAGDSLDWGKKEIDEQAYVSRYINQKLRETGIDFEQSELATISAGPVAHLQTIFSGKIDNKLFPEMIKNLHPTPAVCGIPKEKAMELIVKTEKHNRKDYTGFLGPVNEGKISLFVNLRSALVTQNILYLFVGGGITADSIADKEWEETGLKAKTLIDCYKNC